MTRRIFLAKMVSGFVLLSGGCSKRKLWSVCGSDKGILRFVFYTDAHARMEWKTPAAIESDASAINKRKVDLVITGGDL